MISSTLRRLLFFTMFSLLVAYLSMAAATNPLYSLRGPHRFDLSSAKKADDDEYSKNQHEKHGKEERLDQVVDYVLSDIDDTIDDAVNDKDNDKDDLMDDDGYYYEEDDDTFDNIDDRYFPISSPPRSKKSVIAPVS